MQYNQRLNLISIFLEIYDLFLYFWLSHMVNSNGSQKGVNKEQNI